MQSKIKARRFGGSIGIILPRKIVERERINPEDFLEVSVEKIADLSFLWGKGKDIKKSTAEIMAEIDEGEDE
ncbi:MAG: hypothetical protein KKB79_02390 [Nanoarchaeota archaeon]|nr:hypothetical protein [Nanoarchaeota archaeon]